MGRKTILLALMLAAVLALPGHAVAQSRSQVKISVFNFGTANIEASGYGTTVSNMLTATLAADPVFAMMDRKELEAFLTLNDLQQNDNMTNAVNIGSRLGLEVVVIGTVEKRGSLILIRANVVSMEKRRSLHHARVGALGDAGLMTEVQKLAVDIRKAVTSALRAQENGGGKGPANLQKRAGNRRVLLFWDAPPEGRILHYEVYRANEEKGPFARVGATKSPEYTDENLDRDRTYYYRVRGVDTRGITTGFSPVVSAETAPTPNPPIILSAERHVRSILLTWSPNPVASDDPLKLTGYKVYRAKTENGPYKEVGQVLGSSLDIALDKLLKVPYTDKNLADGEDYYYQVTVYNEKGLESDASRPFKGTAIPAVTGLAARGDMIREIELTWNPIDEFYVRGYSIYRSTTPDKGFLKIGKTHTTPVPEDKKMHYTDTEGLADKTKYYYRVAAFEEADLETSPSVTVSAVTKGKPPTPTNLKAAGGAVKRVELTWTPRTEMDVEGYNLYWSTDKKGKLELLKKLPGRTTDRHTDDGRGMSKLADGQTYFYTITSYNKVDVESEPAPTVTTATKARPAKPSGLKGDKGKARQVPLSWTANPEKDIAAYHLFRAEAEADRFSPLAKVAGNTTRYIDKDLKDGAAYRYRIQAEDKDELLSDESDTISVTTKPKPSSPSGLAGKVQADGVTLTWKAGGEKDLHHYIVYEKGVFQPAKLGESKGPSFNDRRPLKSGKDRTYLVTAVDGDSLESNPSSELTVVAP